MNASPSLYWVISRRGPHLQLAGAAHLEEVGPLLHEEVDADADRVMLFFHSSSRARSRPEVALPITSASGLPSGSSRKPSPSRSR